ncbi:MAG TPA: bifunctional diaminohydroxyphosphoribosylaminopyrimidine deaminase/5-amino-6-(5-phosphoribosylamino)uracil reductase RibD, partial [Firmicutes bacterium]|nr:bifunctional diaminohydroxyphosphoribosylaminopyrimidine deaminase/5-amino-6-(5-phosphoribosylamino)uracil reductase RibD [Bacillota bacterium]
MESDERYMWMVLDLARKGWGRTSPNPMVGAVLVKNGEVVGTGFHQRAGEPHAEIIALAEAGEKARGASMYTNLEPCCHFGRTPPCTDALIEAGIRKVVTATRDPNPLVSGRGLARLQQAGIKVKSGVLEEKARRLNEVFFKYITSGTPFVVVKAAMTLDGKIATSDGRSRWITGEKSRNFVHRLRSKCDGIMVGINTVLQDNPNLNVRLEGEEENRPKRIIVDSRGRLPLDAVVVKTAAHSKTILATTALAPAEKLASLRSRGVEVLVLPIKDDKVDLQALMGALGKQEISVLLVESGGTLNYSLLEQNLIDKLYCFIAPILFGGKDAPTPLEGSGIGEPDKAWIVKDL